ncbi:hypothetical protein [Methylobacterium sp. J-076]|uniref:hypothetical protein n=1 Tax=Methylobacterium sp. J-076 TaxID=2836655 RepID=UPI001FB93097|nr:hypothetical protein [Methylobacterium sp. J-076]MCJ2012212.1 hypothetical protein [Methylobacterium sp. J-076]
MERWPPQQYPVYPMNGIKRFFSKLASFMSARHESQASHQSIDLRNSSGSDTKAVQAARDFDGDYRSATAMLKERMRERFPDNFHARVGANANSSRDFGDERASAIDTASAAIASALRKGATARQAADAGAASVGI